MSRIQRYWVCVVSFVAVVAISVSASLLWTGGWMPGLPIGIIAGVPVGTLVSWSFRPKGERKAAKD